MQFAFSTLNGWRATSNPFPQTSSCGMSNSTKQWEKYAAN